MRTIEVSDEVYAAIVGFRANVDPNALDFLLVLLLTYIQAKDPTVFEAQWSEMKKLLPSIPIWEQWSGVVENLAGPVRKRDGVMGGAA